MAAAWAGLSPVTKDSGCPGTIRDKGKPETSCADKVRSLVKRAL